MDLAAEGTQVSDDEIARIQALKTGALIEFACDAGAVLGSASTDQRQALRIYGNALGQAFQLADDLLDVYGDAGQVGKATGKDGAAGKATMWPRSASSGARARLEALELKAISAEALWAEGRIFDRAARFVTRRRH